MEKEMSNVETPRDARPPGTGAKPTHEAVAVNSPAAVEPGAAADKTPPASTGSAVKSPRSTVKPSEPPTATAAATVTASEPPRKTIESRRTGLRRFVPVLVLLIAAALLIVITTNWDSGVGGKGNQKTDDAYLQGDITPLSTRISGSVSQVAVQDYQRVKAGDLLVQIKDDDYRAQLDQAQAAVQAAQAALEGNAKQKALQDSRISGAEAGVEAARADIEQAEAGVLAARADITNAQAGVDAAKADVVRTELEKRRQEALVETASATKQKLEQVTADADRFQATIDSRKADLAKANASLSLRQAELDQSRAGLAGRQADLQAQQRQRAVLDSQESQLKADLTAKEGTVKVAQTNLDYTRIVAPTDGIVGERKVRVGQLVSPGMQVLSLVEDDLWVQANYKETQLTNVRKGDSAQIEVDTFPGLKLSGHVEEIAPASGSQFALLPPDNASGNFTKITQRIPVKIAIDRDPRIADRLRPGMSVVVDINASGKGGDSSASSASSASGASR